MSAPTGRVSTSGASIAQGRRAYADGLYKLAIENFTLVANDCPCNHGKNGRRERCKCKDFAKIALDGGDIFREAMHKCSCGVAQRFDKCHEATHIQALDYRVHVFEKMNRQDKAKRDAEWLLEIAPRALEGYLRLGKAYRLANEPDVAYAIWTAGIEVGGREGHGGSVKLNQLLQARAPLHIRFARKDPLRELPLELIERIFHSFTTKQLVQCQRVSKTWNAFLKSSSRLWADIELDSNRMPPFPWLKELRKVTHGNVSSLAIRGRSGISRSMHKTRWLALFLATQRLNHLVIRLAELEGPILLFKEGNVWSHLRSLRIDPSPSPQSKLSPGDAILPLLQRNKHCLEHVSLASPEDSLRFLARDGGAIVDTRISQLRSLHACMGGSVLPSSEFMSKVAENTPRLEQLSISTICLVEDQESTANEPSTPPLLHLWPDLKAVRLENPVAVLLGADLDVSGQLVMPLAGIRSYESYRRKAPASIVQSPFNLLSHYCRFVQDQRESDGLEMQYPTLECFWVEGIPIASPLIPCLKQSFEKGALSALGITVLPPERRVEDGAAINSFLQDVAWMSGETSVTRLGIFDFYFDDHDGPLASGSGYVWKDQRVRIDALVEFINSFPNLDTLVLSSSEALHEHIALVVERVLSEGRVASLFVDHCPGAIRDTLSGLAKKKGVTIGFESTAVRPRWPLDLGSRTR